MNHITTHIVGRNSAIRELGEMRSVALEAGARGAKWTLPIGPGDEAGTQGEGEEVFEHEIIRTLPPVTRRFSGLHVHPMNTGTAIRGVRRCSTAHGWGGADSAGGR
jgi:hypothetical protein